MHCLVVTLLCAAWCGCIYSQDADTVYSGYADVAQLIREATLAVNRVINKTLEQNDGRNVPMSKKFKRLPSSPQSVEMTRAKEIYDRAVNSVLQTIHESRRQRQKRSNRRGNGRPEETISAPDVSTIAQQSHCLALQPDVNCLENLEFHMKYRSYAGTCNNLNHVLWGSALTGLTRLLNPGYVDGLNTPRGWYPDHRYNGYKLPSAREVSLQMISTETVSDDADATGFVMQWGQFVDHDLSLTPEVPGHARFSDGLPCNETCGDVDNQAPCFPIPVDPQSDPRVGRTCLGMTRSGAVCSSSDINRNIYLPGGSGQTTVEPRQQLNEITAYMDGSNVYGSSEEAALELRDISNGLLRTGIVQSSNKHLLPFNAGCQIDSNTNRNLCHFVAGDVRVNENLGLAVTHTLWMREHNRVAEELLGLNPDWSDDTIYNEARHIVAAQLQHITYTQWLPKILGQEGMALIPNYAGYNQNQDASILNPFATAAYRLHVLINPIVYRYNDALQPTGYGHMALSEAFFSPLKIVDEGGIDPLIRGIFGHAGKKVTPDELLNSELTERLFMSLNDIALDLASLNIQRGRDHGLQPYNEYRKFCNLRNAEKFRDLDKEITNNAVLRKLEDLYGHPGNIDLWVGGLVEDRLPGASVGPTFACIIAEQFRRIRDGDRFWYENPSVFQHDQLMELKKTSLARIICDNSDGISKVQTDVFRKAGNSGDYVPCTSTQIPAVDLKRWADGADVQAGADHHNPSADSGNRRPSSGGNRHGSSSGRRHKRSADQDI